MKNTALVQMDLGMKSQIRNRAFSRRDRMRRATWWFNRMREVVEHALPSRAEPAARPEQTYLGLRQTTLL